MLSETWLVFRRAPVSFPAIVCVCEDRFAPRLALDGIKVQLPVIGFVSIGARARILIGSLGAWSEFFIYSFLSRFSASIVSEKRNEVRKICMPKRKRARISFLLQAS